MSSFILLVQHEREYGEQELCSWLLDCDCYVSGQSQEWPRIPGLICLLSLLENPESFLRDIKAFSSVLSSTVTMYRIIPELLDVYSNNTSLV